MRHFLYLLAIMIALPAVAQRAGTFEDLATIGYAGMNKGGSLASVTFTSLGTNVSTSSALDYATAASCAPSANSLILCFTASDLSGWVVPTNVIGCNLTWALVTSTNYVTGGQGISLWRSMTNATPPAGTITSKYAGTQTGGAIFVCQFGNVDTSGANGAGAIVQVVRNTNATANAFITLASLTGTRNVPSGFFGNVDNNGAWATTETGWVLSVDTGYNTPATGIFETHVLGGSTDNTITVTNGAAQWAGIGIEVKAVP